MKKGEFYQYLYTKMEFKSLEMTSKYELGLRKFVNQIYDLSFDVVEPLNKQQTDILRRRFGILISSECQTLETIAHAYKIGVGTVRQLLLNSEIQIMRYIKAQAAFKNINLDTLISNLNISNRIRNSLLQINVITIRDLLAYSEYELLKVKGIGHQGVAELSGLIKILGYNLKYDEFSNVEDNISNTSIKYLNLSARFTNLLFRKHIFTIEELITYSKDELLKISGMGAKGVNEIEHVLNSLGYQLASKEDVNDSEYKDENLTLNQLKRIRAFIAEQQDLIAGYSTDSVGNHNHMK